MELHYNAFISYRHHPEDIRAATQIHRLLERFPVPKALRKQGKQRYTLPELIQTAREQLGDFRLTDEQRQAYGLS